jgi:hypothetical protein
MRWVVLVCGVVSAGCGRWGFDSQDEAAPPDSLVEADAPSVAPTGFVCNEPQRFASSGAPISAMTAVATSSGNAVFMADTAGNLAGWTYQNADGMLLPTSANVAIDTDVTSTISAAAQGNSIVVSAIKGLAASTGTSLYPRDKLGSSRGPVAQYTEFGADRALAVSPGGQFALAHIDVASRELRLRAIDTLGNGGSQVVVAPALELASYATIGSGSSGYVVQWNAGNTSPSSVRIALVDQDFGVVAGPVTANGQTTEGPISPHVLWAKTSDTYLATWHEKNGSDDDVWYQLRGPDLAPITISAVLSSSSCCTDIATDGVDFWITWLDFAGNKLVAARISATGVVTQRSVMSSGGTPVKWTMLQSGLQPVLVWIESGGTGPEMWIDPLCP